MMAKFVGFNSEHKFQIALKKDTRKQAIFCKLT